MSNSNANWVLSSYKPGTHFTALGFAKHSGCEDWSSSNLNSSPRISSRRIPYRSSPDVEEHNAEFEAMFQKLDNSSKRVLSTGKCVDNELIIFGIQCPADHPSRSLTIDPYDENYAQYKVFTPEELEEIKLYQCALETFFDPKDLKIEWSLKVVNSSQKIRTALGANPQFHANYDKDINADE